MPELKKVTQEEAANFCIEDILQDPVRSTTLRTIHTAYHTSDKDEYGQNMFGSAGVVGMYIIAQVYHISPLGTYERIERELQEKVFVPLGFELSSNLSAGNTFYNELGKSITSKTKMFVPQLQI